ncbi:MAG TPA: hypothetical protein VIJ22_00320 [Polyangiaceae bacterium]
MTRAPPRVILSLVMAAMLHFDLPRTYCAAIGFAQCKPIAVDMQSS